MISDYSIFMEQALALALKAKGQTAPNPPVGALVLNEKSEIIGRGFHPKAGEPHAEVFAINEALIGRSSLTDCSLVVTLEPCNHTGKTPPCVDLILKSQISRVIVGSIDPNPLMQGGSLKRLEENGVEVQSGILKTKCDQLIQGFTSVMKNNRPYVVLKCAVSLDGKMATETGESKWITGIDARVYAHQLRAASDAVLVGVETVLSDNPQLDARLFDESKNPRKVVLDSRLRTPVNAKILSGKGQTLIYCDKVFSKTRKEELEKAGAVVVPLDAGNGEVDLSAVLENLAKQGVQELLVEGGAKVLGSFLRQGLFDEIKYFMAPKIIGEKGKTVFEGFNIQSLGQSPVIRDLRVKVLGQDFVFEGFR